MLLGLHSIFLLPRATQSIAVPAAQASRGKPRQAASRHSSSLSQLPLILVSLMNSGQLEVEDLWITALPCTYCLVWLSTLRHPTSWLPRIAWWCWSCESACCRSSAQDPGLSGEVESPNGKSERTPLRQSFEVCLHLRKSLLEPSIVCLAQPNSQAKR